MYKNLLYFLILILSFSIVIAKGKPGEKKVKAFKAETTIILDGKLNEPVWKNQPVKEFLQRDPEEGAAASEETHVWVAFDQENLYIAARMYDSKPEQIDRSLMRRDGEMNSDWFYLYLDPYNDDRTGYYFAVNPGGSLVDGILYNDSWRDNAWDGIWEARSEVDEGGWCTEIKIPFSQLRFNKSDEMTWGVNFNRDIKRNNEMSFFVMVPKAESGFVSHFADLVGIDGVESTSRFEATPYLVQKAQYLVHDAEDPFYKSNQYKTTLGADFKVGIGSSLNLDLTINPDFGQVEVDPAVVNLSAFETFYDEKRPFFIEGNTIFEFGYGGANNNWGFNFGNPNLFYSRRIGSSPHMYPDYDDAYINRPRETRILGAAKLTGKIAGDWSVGALSAVTERTYAKINNNGNQFEEEVEPLTHYGVIRAQRQFDGGRQAVGFIATAVNRELRDDAMKENLSKGAYTFGLDGWTMLDDEDTYVLKASLIGSYTHGTKEYMQNLQQRPYRYFQRPDAENYTFDPDMTSMSGWYGRVMLNKQKGNFYINAALGAISPKFEYNDLGSQWMGDRINGHFVMGYRWYEPDGTFRYKNAYLCYTRMYDFDGNLLRNGFYTTGFLRLMNYFQFGFSGGLNLEQYSNTITRGGPIVKTPANFHLNFNANTDNRKDFILYAGAFYWKDGNGSYNVDASLDLEWRPNTQINFTFGPSYSYEWESRQWVDSFEDALAINTYGSRYVYGEMSRHTISGNIRLNWTFTPQISLQLFLQPLFSVGDYENFKELGKAGTNEYITYSKSNISYDTENEEYTIDPDGDGEADKILFDNPDFNFKSLRANVVLRWEVKPGSIFYLVWSHDQANFDHPGDFSFGRDFKSLWSEEADDIFLMKFSYWLDF